MQSKNQSSILKTLSNLGRLYLESGQSGKGLEALNGALELSHVLKDRDQEAYVLGSLARYEKQAGLLHPALGHINEAVAILEQLRVKVLREDLKVSYFSYARPAFESEADILLLLNREEPGKGWDQQAFAVSETAHGRSMLERLPALRNVAKSSVPPALLSRQNKLAEMIQEKGGATESVDDLLADYYETQRQIRAVDPAYAELLQPQPLTVNEVRRTIDPDTVVLEYLLGEFRSYVFVVSVSDFAVFELPNRDKIVSVAKKLQESIAVRERSSSAARPVNPSTPDQADARFWETAGTLGDMLLTPVLPYLGTRRVMIVADGALQLVPFSALPIAATDSSRKPMPLMLTNQVVMVSSLSVLMNSPKREEDRDLATKRIAVLADPVYEREDGRLLALPKATVSVDPRSRSRGFASDVEPDLSRALRARGAQRGSYARLFGAADEAEAIRKASGGRLVTIRNGFDANRPFALSGALDQFGIIHFATHGIVNDQNPELSGLVLSLYDRDGRVQKGFLRLIDIYSLHLRANLVVLSACETALGRNADGEGVIGLTRGFLYAGAKRVISTLWRVQDESTADFMAQFYSALLRDHLTPGAALRAAQMKMWKSREWRSPYYWAAFVIYGD